MDFTISQQTKNRQKYRKKNHIANSFNSIKITLLTSNYSLAYFYGCYETSVS